MASDAAWSEAVAREAVIRRLISLERPGRSDFLRAWQPAGSPVDIVQGDGRHFAGAQAELRRDAHSRQGPSAGEDADSA